MNSKQKLTIMQHNIAKSPQSLSLLINSLESNLPDIFLIQEPPFHRVGLHQSHLEKEGETTYGMPTLPQYHTFLPPGTRYNTLKDFPRVCTLVKKSIPLTLIVLDPKRSPNCNLVTIQLQTSIGDLSVTNVYNGVHHRAEEDFADKHLEELAATTGLLGPFACEGTGVSAEALHQESAQITWNLEGGTRARYKSPLLRRIAAG